MKKGPKAVFWIIVIVLVIAGLAMLSGGKDKTADGPIKIGGAFALTGFAAEWGEESLAAAEMAIAEANAAGGVGGKEIVLVVEDIQSEAVASVSAVKKLIEVDKVVAVIGPTWLDTWAGAAPLSTEAQIPMISPDGFITAIKANGDLPYVFSLWFRGDRQAVDFVEYIAEQGITKMSLFLNKNPFWEVWGDLVVKEAEVHGIEIVESFKFLPEERDFRTLLARTEEDEVEAIFFGFEESGSLLAFLKQEKDAGLDVKLYTTEYIESFVVQEEYQELLAGVEFTSPQVEEDSFIERYKSETGRNPVFNTANTYDTVNVLLEAIAAVGTGGNDIRDYLSDNTFDTVTFGEVSFDGLGGVTGGTFVVKTLRDGELVVLE